MSKGFKRATRGRVSIRLDAAEAEVLRSLAGQMINLVDSMPGGADNDQFADELGVGGLEISEDAARPDDPVLARLFPDAYSDDSQSADDFRRYTQGGLRDGRHEAADTLMSTVPERGGTVTLDSERAQQWLRALNDLRLALGTRLGVTEEIYEAIAHMPTDDPRYAAFAIYDWLSFVQESLVEALS